MRCICCMLKRHRRAARCHGDLERRRAVGIRCSASSVGRAPGAAGGADVKRWVVLPPDGPYPQAASFRYSFYLLSSVNYRWHKGYLYLKYIPLEDGWIWM